MLIRLQHPNIVSVHALESVDGIGECIVMEFVDGMRLSEIHANKDEYIRLVDELLSAVAYCHSLGIVHRDLKPSNIMITRNGNHVKLIDFGLADSDSNATLKQPAGTPKYMSPEQAQTNVADIRNDIYSLGVIFRQLPDGTVPKAVIRKCLAPAEKRYKSVKSLKNAINNKRLQGRRLVVGAFTAVVIALLALVGFLLMKVSQMSKDIDFMTKDPKTKHHREKWKSTAESGIIEFADPMVKEICVDNWDLDGDGELSMDEAAEVSGLGNYFKKTPITSFDELRFFTGLELIERSAFNKCTRLKHVELPEQITTIDNFAFLECKSLQSIQFPANLQKIGEYAFNECDSIIELSFPDSLQYIANAAFGSCKNLKSVRFNNARATIGTWCFGECKNLSEVALGSELKGIDQGVFFECSSLRKIIIPDKVKSIGDDAFHNCTSLEEIYVGDEVDSIGEATFWGDESLKSISLPNIDVLKSPNIFVPDVNQYLNIQQIVIRHGDAGTHSFDRNFSRVSDSCRFIVPKGTASTFRSKGYPHVYEE